MIIFSQLILILQKTQETQKMFIGCIVPPKFFDDEIRTKYAVSLGCNCEGCNKAMKVMIKSIYVYEQTKKKVFNNLMEKFPLVKLVELKKFDPDSPSNDKYGTWYDKNTIFGVFWDAIKKAVNDAYPKEPHLIDGVQTHLVFYTYIQLWTKNKFF